ncbi:MAG: phycobilisome rod-core linker polypeptide [Phormidesmis sp.]
MPSTFVNPVVNPDRQLGVNVFQERSPIRLWPTSSATDSADELEIVIRAIYNQVLGNAYVMESERQQIPESQFRRGELTVMEFIRQIAYSDLYRSRFFENGPRNRFIELNFKHFLGRAPESRAEVAYHSALLDNGGGYEAEIDAYLDSDEYLRTFGTDTVPYYRGYKTEGSKTLAGFTHMFALLRGASSSDKNVMANNPARLSTQLFANKASSVISPTGATNRQGRSSGMSTDEWIRSILQRPTSGGAVPTPTVPTATGDIAISGLDNSELAVKARAQAKQLEQLEAQLANLRPLSNMGAAMLRKGQRPQMAAVGAPQAMSQVSGLSELESQVSAQATRIEKLKGELMSARSLANIAEFKLNKWRARSF